jgi:hypothetical protein
MRILLLATVAVAGIALAGIPTTSAAPAGGTLLAKQPSTETLVTQVGHCRYSHWRRWCHRHHWRWSRR